MHLSAIAAKLEDGNSGPGKVVCPIIHGRLKCSNGTIQVMPTSEHH